MHDAVKDYYGQVLHDSADLKTNACCAVAPPAYLQPILALLHDEVVSRYYGCGLVVPPLLNGMRVLDLGCGAGRDCFLLSVLVGAHGSVVGVDMTAEQLEVANRHIDYHREIFALPHNNVEFKHGYIELLNELQLADNSFDVIISNCVINLSPDKESVLREAYRVLKPGGELYFSDIYADRRVPEALRNDTVLYGECLSGALYWHDFLALAKQCGFQDPRLVEDNPIDINDATIAARVGNIRFYSATYRLFKIAELETACEDYGQAVIYRGTVPDQADRFILDKHHYIERGRVFPVCGNTWRMLQQTRLQPHFDFIGDFSEHFGIFEGCGIALPFDEDGTASFAGGGACC